MLKTLLILVMPLLFSKVTTAQKDTEFWFAVPEITAGPNSYDRPIVFRIATFATAARVIISQPANAGFVARTINVPAKSVHTEDVTSSIELLETKPANTILNYGLRITSTAPVTIYYEVVSSTCKCNPEVFVLKGRNALGTNFMIPSQNFLDNAAFFSPRTNSSFDIVATENNTLVTITPSKRLIGRAANVTFNVRLRRGQVFSSTAFSGVASEHLNGSTVVSNKPIAITIKDDVLNASPVYGTCTDAAGDQIVPIKYLGKEYIAVNGFLKDPGDQLYVMAIEDNTAVYRDGVLLNTINKGQQQRIPLGNTNTAAYITASKVVSVLHMSGYGCEFGIDMVPTLTCTGSDEVVFVKSVAEQLFINVFIKAGSENDFLVNGLAGVITGATFFDVPGTNGNYKYARIVFGNNYNIGDNISISNTKEIFHASIIHGSNATGARFGYFSNFSKYKTLAAAQNNFVCEGGDVFLEANTDGASGNFTWTGPNGFTSAQPNPVINNVTALNTGYYYVNASMPVCETTFDSVYIRVGVPSKVTNDTILCEGNSYVMPLGNTITVSNSFYDSTVLENSEGCDSIIVTKLTAKRRPITEIKETICEGEVFNGYATTGMYIDTLNAINACDSIVKLHLTVVPLPNPLLGNDIKICRGDSLTLFPGNYDSYIWSTGTNAPFIKIGSTGIYNVLVTNICGSKADDIYVEVEECKIGFPNAFTPNGDGLNDVFKMVNGFNITNYKLLVYDRYGRTVFETNNPTFGWNGMLRGVALPIGTYVYTCSYTLQASGERFNTKGTVSLIR
jgi:gliding motility-associated-like protein